MTQENKDALYREGTTDAEKQMCEYIEKEHGKDAWNPCGNGYSVKDVEGAYLAGRRKGQEELSKLQALYDDRSDMLRDLRDENTSQFGEIESLKKEIEELRLKNKHNLSIDLSSYKELCRINSDYDKENQKLRELVELSVGLLKYCNPTTALKWNQDRDQLYKEASEVLSGK